MSTWSVTEGMRNRLSPYRQGGEGDDLVGGEAVEGRAGPEVFEELRGRVLPDGFGRASQGAGPVRSQAGASAEAMWTA